MARNPKLRFAGQTAYSKDTYAAMPYQTAIKITELQSSVKQEIDLV